jgi:hypothetical protein
MYFMMNQRFHIAAGAILLMAVVTCCRAQNPCDDQRYLAALERIRSDSSVIVYLFPKRKPENLDVTVSDSLGCPQDDLDAFGKEIYPWIDSLSDSLHKSGTALQYGTQCEKRRCPCLVALLTTMKGECTVYFSQIDENFLSHSALSVNIMRHYPGYEIDRWLVCWVVYNSDDDIVRVWTADLQE